MTVQVGGVTIGIGVNVANFQQGIKSVYKQLASFQTTLKNIRLENAIKGDPFKQTRDYFKATESALNKVFKSWSKGITYVGDNTNMWAKAQAIETTAIIKNYSNIEKKMKQLASSSKVFTLESQVEPMLLGVVPHKMTFKDGLANFLALI